MEKNAEVQATSHFQHLLQHKPTIDDLVCSKISTWYPKFRKCTMLTEFISLPETFIKYLQSDESLTLPKCPPNCKLQVDDPRYEVGRDPYQSSDDDSWDEVSQKDSKVTAVDDCRGNNISSELSEPVTFPILEQEITSVINRLGGSVFTRTEWTAPTDVRFFSIASYIKNSKYKFSASTSSVRVP